MSELTGPERKRLLELAREAILSELENREMKHQELPENLREMAGVFVTLNLRGELRGCIGTLEPVDEIAESVVRNSRAAAFGDSRFEPLRMEEINEIVIEISILSPLTSFSPESPEDLVRTLGDTKPGLVIFSGVHRATFLPHVWEELSDPAAFLSNLCMKAGLPPMYWRDHFEEMEFQKYTADSFSEADV